MINQAVRIRSGPACGKRQEPGFFYVKLAVSLLVALVLGSGVVAWSQSGQTDDMLLPEEKEWLKQHNNWRVGVDPAWPPVEMIVDEGVYSGIGADYMRLITQRLLVSMEVLPGLSWSQVIDKARNGEVDILPAVTHTVDRSAYLNFSDVYINIPLVIITRIDKKDIGSINDLSGKKVSVVESYPIQEWLAKDHPNIIRYPSRDVSYALEAVAFGQVDAYIGDIASASFIIKRLNITGLKVAANTQYSFAERIGVRKDWPELIPILNKALATITKQEHDEIQSKWITFSDKNDFRQMLRESAPFISAAVFLILVGANIVLGRVIRRLKVSERSLRLAEQRLNDIVYSSADWVWEVDTQGRYTYVSDNVTSILGYTPGEIIGKSPFDFMLPQEASRIASMFSAIAAAKKPIKDLEHFYITKDGKTICLLTNGVPVLDEKGSLTGYRGVDKDITEKKRVDAQLRESEERLSSIFETSPEGILIADSLTRKFIMSNRSICQMLGYDKEEFLDLGLGDIHPDQHLAFVQKEFERLSNNEIGYSPDIPMKRKDGSIFYADIRAAVTTLGDRKCIVGFFSDITSRKKTEDELRLMQFAMDNSADTVFQIAPDARLLYVNQTGCRQLGYSFDELTHMKIHDLDPDYSAEKWPEHWRQFREKKTLRFESMYTTKAGLRFPVEIFANHLTFGDQEFVIAFIRDISDRKRSEAAMRESEKRLLETQKLAQLGHWVWDIKTGNVEWSEEVFNIFHLDPKEFTPHIDSIQALSPWPEDHERDRELIRRATQSHEKGSYEQRFLLPDKSTGYYYSTFQGHYDEAGNLVSIVGTVMDITARKRIEEELREKTAFLESQTEASIDGLLVVDSKGQRILTNQQLLKMWDVPAHIVEDTNDEALLQYVVGMTRYPDQFLERVRYLYSHQNETSRDEVEFKNGKVFDRYSSPVIGRNGKYYGRIWIFRDITERKRAEKALQDLLTFSRETISDAGEGVVVYDMEFRYLEWNRFMENMTGVKKDFVIGKCAFDLFPHLREQGVDKLLMRALAGETVISPDTQYRSPLTGKSGWIAGTYSPHRDAAGNIIGVIGLIRDITERKKIEAALEESQAYLNALINTIVDPIFVKDRQHRFVLVNDSLCTFVGRSREELIGKTDYDFFPKEQVDVFLQIDEQVFNTGAPNINEESITHASGHVSTILTKKSLYEDKAGNKYIVGVIHDISYMKELEQKERLAQLGRLVADMAHEVNNPLMIISGNAQLSLMEDIGNPKVKENLAIIINESQRAKHIIQRLLKFSRPSKGNIKEVDINKVIETVAGIIEHQFSLSNITVHKILASGLPVAKIDEQQFQELIMNLLNNAKDAMPSGGTLEIRTGLDQGMVKIDITDSGCGIPEDVREKIFEPFFSTKEKGTGLGLAICHSIIRAHNGEIKLKSQEGKGTTFSILLPGG